MQKNSDTSNAKFENRWKKRKPVKVGRWARLRSQRELATLKEVKNNFEGEEGSGPVAQQLCTACALCCNGVIFADVKLQGPDQAARLRDLGLPVTEPRPVRTKPGKPPRTPWFPQPCAALTGCRCRIYRNRPAYCRQFACALLNAVSAGVVSPAKALRIVRGTRAKAAKVGRLLQSLGDTDKHLPLARRFRRTGLRLDHIGFDRSAAMVYAALTLAMHDLNLSLSEKFYPGSTEA